MRISDWSSDVCSSDLGGVIATVADVAGGYASYSLFDDASDVLTVEFKLNLLAPALGPFVTAVGEVLRSGRTLTVCSLRIFDHHAGEPPLCAAGHQTLIRRTADSARRRSAAAHQRGDRDSARLHCSHQCPS